MRLEVPDIVSLYVHVPWCVKKCPYCDFNSHQIVTAIDESAYLEALLADFRQELPLVRGRVLETMFIGGGTPSTLSPGFYQELLTAIRQQVTVSADAEITMEANPGSVDAARFEGYRQAGINRLSIGFQSLQNSQLQRLGRIHDAELAIEAFNSARLAGFENINIDLMFALPHQKPQMAMQDLQGVMALAPEHISWYQLTLEPNTYFHHQPPAGLPDDEMMVQIQDNGMQQLEALGYQRYEISAFSRPSFQCRHNLNYWQYGDYVGVGAGAHGKITTKQGSIWRSSKKRQPAEYLRGNFISGKVQVPPQERVAEYFMNRFRLRKPVQKADFEQRTGMSRDTIEPQVQQAIDKKLVLDQEDKLIVTEFGYRFLNDLVCIFM